jgi:hypothetical protein
MAFAPATGTKTNFLASLRRTMQYGWFGNTGEATQFGQPPTILNGEFVTAINAANTGVVNIIGVDANNKVVFGDAQLFGYATVSLTAANIIAMRTTPVTILAAPGAGKAIIVSAILFEMTTTSTQFTGGGTVNFPYHGGSNCVPGVILAAVVTTTAGTSNTLLGPDNSTNGLTVPANTGIDITNGSAAFAAGTGTAKVQIWYSVVTL